MRVTVGSTEVAHDSDGTYTVFVVHVTEEDGREYDVRRRFSKFEVPVLRQEGGGGRARQPGSS